MQRTLVGINIPLFGENLDSLVSPFKSFIWLMNKESESFVSGFDVLDC